MESVKKFRQMKTLFFFTCSIICFSQNLYSSETLTNEEDYNSIEYSYEWTSFESSAITSSISMYRSNTCPNSLPFCTSDSYNFPASTNVPNMGSVGCLLTTPNPAWYWMEIANPGNIDIRISSGGDVDFIAWGPFTSLSAACASDLMSNPGVDCSYSTAAQETVNIVGAVTGQVYVLLITNYANITTNISFQQIGGNGSTNCGIIAPPISNNGPLCVGDTLNLIVTNPTPGATYSWTGPGNWSSNAMNPSRPNITVAQAGSYSMTITVGTQVSPPVTTQVSVYPIPDVSISATDTTICIGESTSLNATGSPSFVWSGGLGTNNPIVVSPTITTSYMVTGTANGCSNSDTITIYVVPKPTVTNVSILDDYCSSNTGQISFSHTGGTPPILIDWDTTPPSQDTIITNLPAGSYTLTITDSNLCSYTASYQIISIAGPTISNSSVTNATCNQPNGGVNIVINTTQNLTYQWSTSPPQTSQNI